MQIKNTIERYGAISKSFHWAIAILILVIILVGLYMGDLPNSPDKFKIYAMHKSFGLLVLWLAGLRILWLIYTKPPEAHETHKKWEKFLAKITHLFLYLAMIGLPLSGWMMSSAGGHPVGFFGLKMPAIVEPDKTLGGLAHEAHETMAYLLIMVIGLHVIGALKHHFIDGDGTLKRMLPDVFRKTFRLFILLLLVIFAIGVFQLGVLEELNEKEETEIEDTREHEEDKHSHNRHDPFQWTIVKEQSRIKFEADVYNKSFTGFFLISAET